VTPGRNDDEERAEQPIAAEIRRLSRTGYPNTIRLARLNCLSVVLLFLMGALVIAVAVVAVFWPRVQAWQLAFVCAWLGVAWILKGIALRRKSQRTMPDGRSPPLGKLWRATAKRVHRRRAASSAVGSRGADRQLTRPCVHIILAAGSTRVRRAGVAQEQNNETVKVHAS
jgi:hypothetical protein